MQLMTFNSLLMFDIVFVFFLFLVGVTCLVYYLPPANRKSSHTSHSADYSQRATASQLAAEDFVGIRVQDDDDEESINCYRQQFHRYQQCPHHHDYHHREYTGQQQQQVAPTEQHFRTNRYSPTTTMSSSRNSRTFSRSYIPLPATPTEAVVSSDEEDQMNMEILPDQDQSMIKSHKSSRHLYHNILNSAFEHEGEAYEDDECNMIATNVQIVTTPTAMGISTSLPASPSRSQQTENNEQTNKSNPAETVINIANPLPAATTGNLRVAPGLHHPHPLTYQHRRECQSGRHVVGICQYHMQQHLRNHHQQHQLHRLYQQKQMMQTLAEKQQQQSGSGEVITPSASFVAGGAGISQEINNSSSSAIDQKKVQYIVVDTTTDRSNKRLNKYCHVKAQNCDIKKSVGPVDQV